MLKKDLVVSQLQRIHYICDRLPDGDIAWNFKSLAYFSKPAHGVWEN